MPKKCGHCYFRISPKNVLIGPLLCLWALPCGLAGLALFLLGLEGPALVLLHLGEPAIRASNFLRADALLAGHHGSIGSTTPPFLEAVGPRVIIVSAGASRQGIHPASEHLRRWRERGIVVFATAEHGSIVARSDGVGLCIATDKGGLHTV